MTELIHRIGLCSLVALAGCHHAGALPLASPMTNDAQSIPDELDDESFHMIEPVIDMAAFRMPRDKPYDSNHPDSELTYNHLAKTGGSFLRRVIGAAIHNPRIEAEGGKLDKRDSTRFTIGSVRNPCEYYTSLYSFGAEGHGGLHNKVPHELLKANSSKTFGKWLKYVSTNRCGEFDHLEEMGMMSARFSTSYAGGPPPFGCDKSQTALKKFDPSSVDCWVKTEAIETGAKSCLLTYQQKTGMPVNWTAFDDAIATSLHNPSHHLPCSEFFDEETAIYVRKIDRQIFEKFGYSTCCNLATDAK